MVTGSLQRFSLNHPDKKRLDGTSHFLMDRQEAGPTEQPRAGTPRETPYLRKGVLIPSRNPKSNFGGNFFVQRSFPQAPFKKLYCPWFSGSPQRGEPENHGNEKFLERGLGRNLFSKRFSPDYFFECESV
jgi:hypothetical protein